MNRLFGSRSSVKSGLVVIPECERGIPSTGLSVRRGVKSFVRNGGHLVVLGSNAKNGRRWLDRIYGWRTKTSTSYSRGGWRRAWNASSDLPRSVSYCNHVEATQMAKMPPGAVSYYSSGGYSGLWSRDIGRGKVTFIAYDWYQGSTCSGDGWTKLLKYTLHNCLSRSFASISRCRALASVPASPASATPSKAVSVYWGAEVDRLREAPYTEDSLRRSGFNISRISSMNRLFGSRSSVKSGLVVIPECERGIPSTGLSVRRGVKSFA